MRSITAPLLYLLVLACLTCASASNADAPAKAESPTHNIAIDSVMYAETGATCAAGFQLETLHSARCTLPNSRKIYCTASPAIANGWACVELAPAKEAPKEAPKTP